MVRRRLDTGDERGESLLELLVAITIMGIAVVAIAGGISISIMVSDSHRKQALASVALHRYAETLESSYSPCSGTTLASYTLPQQPGFNPPTITVAYWTGSWATTCPGGTDPGAQRVTVQLVSTDGRASESLSVVLRKP
jgi:prepilin-type N-terminal cleavage/methylation domain-containing protein